MNRRVVIVEWLDSHGTFGWSPDMEPKPCSCWTVGFVLEETDSYIRLAFGYSDQENVFCTITIPRGAIVGIQEVGVQ